MKPVKRQIKQSLISDLFIFIITGQTSPKFPLNTPVAKKIKHNIIGKIRNNQALSIIRTINIPN